MGRAALTIQDVTVRGLLEALEGIEKTDGNSFLNDPRGHLMVAISNASTDEDIVATFVTPEVLTEGDSDPGLTVEDVSVTVAHGTRQIVAGWSSRFEQANPYGKQIWINWTGAAAEGDVTVGVFAIA